LNRNLQQIDAELQQLEFKGKRAIADLEKKAGGAPELRAQIDAVRGQMEAERARLQQLKEDMQMQVRTVSELPLGSVVTQFNIETPVEVRIGENIFQRLEGGEILIKDGVVEQINT
jgi:seryl-tRNA synthetase